MATLNLARFNPELCGFPKPRIPLLPFKQNYERPITYRPESALNKSFKHYTRGRYALGEAYRLSGVGHEGALLAPAYHCVTMLDPAIALGADVQLYPLNSDLSPNTEKLDDLLATYGKPVKALLATHFFGFAQNFGKLKEWCEKHQIILIEDCSHALFTESFQATGTGIYGRFIASSPYKFFTCEDGGLLFSPENHLLESVVTTPAGMVQELKGIKHTIEKLLSNDSSASEIVLIDELLATLSTTPVTIAKEDITQYSQPSALYTAADTRSASLRCSRFIVSRTSIHEIIRCRQQNYQRWVKAVDSLPNCHTPLPELPENCIPYMFPLHIDHPNPHFYWLKHLGLPVWCWDEMAVSACPIAQDYRLHLLHLPCHQSLTESQMDWMIAAVQKTLRQTSQGAW